MNKQPFPLQTRNLFYFAILKPNKDKHTTMLVAFFVCFVLLFSLDFLFLLFLKLKHFFSVTVNPHFVLLGLEQDHYKPLPVVSIARVGVTRMSHNETKKVYVARKGQKYATGSTVFNYSKTIKTSINLLDQ